MADSSGSTAGSETTGGGSAFDYYPDGTLTMIEEDWELTVTEPDPAVAAPQLATVMTPFEEAGTLYLSFVMNYRLHPSFTAGGMELELWYQGQQLGWLTVGDGVLSTPNEKVTWTQRLELKNHSLHFSVMKGDSTTWGSFGQGNSLHMNITTTLTDLNDYHPNVSVDSSGITYASNRVGTLVLKAVRGYDASGELIAQDKDPVVVFEHGE